MGSLAQSVNDYVMCRGLEKEEVLAARGLSNAPPQNPCPVASVNFADFEVAESRIFSLPQSGFMPAQKKY